MILDQLFLIIVAMSATALGGAVWRVVAGQWPRSLEWPGIALPMGLGLGGSIIGISASFIGFEIGIVLTGVISIISATACLLHFVGDGRPAISDTIKTAFPNHAQAVLIAMMCIAWLGIHAPVLDGDALCYHLEVAKRMTQSDYLEFDPDLHETAYPLVVESLQAVALWARGPIATRGISFLFGISLAYASALLAWPLVGKNRSLWAAVIALCSPIVHCGMTAPLNDVPLAALSVAGLAAWLGVQDHAEISSVRRAILSGLLCGLACGVKFPGIVWAFVVGLVIVFQLVKKFELTRLKNGVNIGAILSPALLFSIAIVIAGGFWYARAGYLTGNPVHPYFRDTFGGNGLDEVLAEDRKTFIQQIINIITAPVVMTFWPSRFDSFSHQIGPLFLALIPLGFLQKRASRWHLLVAVGCLTMALCLTQRQSPRFYIAIIGPWSAAASAVAVSLAGFPKMQSRQIRIAFMMLLMLGLTTTGFNLARSKTSIAILGGVVSPDDWLIEHEPTANIAAWASQNLPENSKLIGQDHRGFYWPRSYTMEKAHRRRLGLLEQLPDSDALIEHYKHQGFTHLVMAEPELSDVVEFDPAISIHLESWLTSHRPLFDQTFTENDGYQRRYRIFDLYAEKAFSDQLKFDGDVKRAAAHDNLEIHRP